MINVAQADLSSLYLFPRQLQPEVLAFNSDFDSSKPLKFWSDPAPKADTEFISGSDASPLVKYQSFRINPVTQKVTKFYFFTTLVQAKATNIPSIRFTSSKPVAEVSFPCRDLEPGESFKIGLGGAIQVINDDLLAKQMSLSPTSSSGFTQEDRDVLASLKVLLTLPSSGPAVQIKDYSEQLNRIETLLGQISIRLSIQLQPLNVTSTEKPVIFK